MGHSLTGSAHHAPGEPRPSLDGPSELYLLFTPSRGLWKCETASRRKQPLGATRLQSRGDLSDVQVAGAMTMLVGCAWAPTKLGFGGDWLRSGAQPRPAAPVLATVSDARATVSDGGAPTPRSAGAAGGQVGRTWPSAPSTSDCRLARLTLRASGQGSPHVAGGFQPTGGGEPDDCRMGSRSPVPDSGVMAPRPLLRSFHVIGHGGGGRGQAFVMTCGICV